MTTNTKCLWPAPAAVLAALFAAACTTSPTATDARSPQPPERRVASINDSRHQSTSYLNGLASAVQAEKRDNDWAAQKEAALRTSFDRGSTMPRGALQSVECRSSKCSLQLGLGAERSPRAAGEQQAAVSRWISVSQPCAYTMTPASSAPQAMLIFLDCKR